MDSMNIHKSNKTVNNRTKQEVLRFIIAKLLKFDRYSGYILQRIKKKFTTPARIVNFFFLICTAYNHPTELLTELLLQLPAQRKWCHR